LLENISLVEEVNTARFFYFDMSNSH
jgi:hypothetical protein